MRLAILVEPQLGASYADQLRLARHAESLGFDAFFRSDHFHNMGAAEGIQAPSDGLPGPTDSWVTLAALAMQTSRIRLGTLLSSATFRLPGLLAITVAQVDQMSGGRVELGLGAGWFETEHLAYGVPFPPVGERFDRLEEQLAVVSGLWNTPSGTAFDFRGKYYELSNSPALPKPLQDPHPPIIVGGYGKRRTPALAARYADEFNVPFGSLEETRTAYVRVQAACHDAGRQPITLSAAQLIACGRIQAEAERRVESLGQRPLPWGTPGRIVDQLGQFAQIGTGRVFLEVLDFSDLDHLDVIASLVMPQLG